VAALTLATASFGAESPLKQTQLSTSSGNAVGGSALIGKPIVMFYEDRNSTEMNQALKTELFRRGNKEGLLKSASVVAIADLEGFNWVPARQFALAAVKKAETDAHIPVYVDWSGVMRKDPWNFSSGTSTVALLDKRGTLVTTFQGTLSEKDTAQFFGHLREMIDVVPSDAGTNLK